MIKVFTLNLSNGFSYPYQVIHSKRAKYIRIKLSRKGELSVTLPTFTKGKLAHEFIQSKRSWIETNLQKVNYLETDALPTTLNLRLLDEYWSIAYKEIGNETNNETGNETNNRKESSSLNHLKLAEKIDYIIELQGDSSQVNNSVLVAKSLNQWCRKKAKIVFNDMMQELAELHGFHYQGLSIRAQKTRWGSCSQQKNINLNCKLLFMPEEVVRYVMIHELCHTIEMNHSHRFWSLVKDCDPQYQAHKLLLKKLGNEVVI